MLVVGTRGSEEQAAWQCLTLRRVRAGDQHHEAQLTTEEEGCVCVLSMSTLWLGKVGLSAVTSLTVNH